MNEDDLEFFGDENVTTYVRPTEPARSQKQIWIDVDWRTSAKGNDYKFVGAVCATVFYRDGMYTGVYEGKYTDKYMRQDTAKSDLYDMIFGRDRE
jgi:hypothetical protein